MRLSELITIIKENPDEFTCGGYISVNQALEAHVIVSHHLGDDETIPESIEEYYMLLHGYFCPRTVKDKERVYTFASEILRSIETAELIQDDD